MSPWRLSYLFAKLCSKHSTPYILSFAPPPTLFVIERRVGKKLDNRKIPLSLVSVVFPVPASH